KHRITDSNVLVLGFTFKENCPDTRNSKVIDVIRQLEDFACNVDIFDPLADPAEVKHEYGIDIISSENGLKPSYEGIMVAVAHDEFKRLDIKKYKADGCVVYDVKHVYADSDEYL
ncbi:MAG TPA: UDP binding domain-containing protein, partial [Deltaproteobacteria bacterium]|nr:UDP binding domain-containing protein [Deltaproteobacteria bacterium]